MKYQTTLEKTGFQAVSVQEFLSLTPEENT